MIVRVGGRDGDPIVQAWHENTRMVCLCGCAQFVVEAAAYRCTACHNVQRWAA